MYCVISYNKLEKKQVLKLNFLYYIQNYQIQIKRPNQVEFKVLKEHKQLTNSFISCTAFNKNALLKSETVSLNALIKVI